MASPVAADSMLFDSVIYLTAAVIAVPLARFLGLGAVIGYLAAGVVIGPWGLGLISDVASTLHFAEIGVVLLLFIIGIELSVMAFLRVLPPGMIATLGQICCCILLALSVNAYFNWTLPQILLIGFILTLSSTAVALMVLQWLG